MAETTGQARTAAREIAERTGESAHDIALVLGSGWRPAADMLGRPAAELGLEELTGFVTPGVAGHAGTIRSLRIGGNRALIMLGRTHLYEGAGVEPVVHGVRTIAATGARTVLLTNAAGGLNSDYQVGEPVLISDHLNLTARSPLHGARFLDLTDLYSPRLRQRARDIDPTLTEGVYAGLGGPQFETPAEIRMLRGMGADLVGMSTVLEAIAARAAGLEVFGLSLVTNLAAGITGEPLDHKEVLEAGKASAQRMGTLLGELMAAA